MWSLTPNILNEESYQCIPCHVSEVTLELTSGRGLLPGESILLLEDWDFQSRLPDLWGGERGWRSNQSPMTNDLISHDCVMKAP